MIRIRPANERGAANHGWLDARHTFSFANYYDPAWMGFRHLRVLNDDRIAAGEGFPEHPHRDMEILTYVLDGAIEHKDSMGNGGVIRAGEFQRMNAGSGVTHSEYNYSKTNRLHLLQVWILPFKKGNQPEYDQRKFPEDQRRNKLCLVASPDGADESFRIYQDLRVYSVLLDPKRTTEHFIGDGRHLWVQVAKGKVRVNGEELAAGDGAALSEETHLELEGIEDADVLIFDMS